MKKFEKTMGFINLIFSILIGNEFFISAIISSFNELAAVIVLEFIIIMSVIFMFLNLTLFVLELLKKDKSKENIFGYSFVIIPCILGFSITLINDIMNLIVCCNLGMLIGIIGATFIARDKNIEYLKPITEKSSKEEKDKLRNYIVKILKYENRFVFGYFIFLIIFIMIGLLLAIVDWTGNLAEVFIVLMFICNSLTLLPVVFITYFEKYLFKLKGDKKFYFFSCTKFYFFLIVYLFSLILVELIPYIPNIAMIFGVIIILLNGVEIRKLINLKEKEETNIKEENI